MWPRASDVAGAVGNLLLDEHRRVLCGAREDLSVLGQEMPDLAQQQDLLWIDLDLTLETIEQVERNAPVLSGFQELRKRCKRLFRFELGDVGLLTNDLARQIFRHVEKADVSADKLAHPLHGG